MTNPVFICIGSNINPIINIKKAIKKINKEFYIKKVSNIYKSPSYKLKDQADYLNLAVLITTEIKPLELKYQYLREIENELGRQRNGDKFTSRTIDLDIALYGDLIINDSVNNLIIPDPEIAEHAFIALPLADLQPDYIHPISKLTLRTYANNFKQELGKSINLVNIKF